MNVYDSARMAEVLAPLGYDPTEGAADADMVIVNTCHIREKASDKMFSELGRLRQLKQARAKTGKRLIVAVAGCVAQAEGEEIQRRAPFVDIVLGPQTYHRLPEMVARASRAAGLRLLDTDFPTESKFDRLGPERRVEGVAQFLSVQEGCDKFCSFCVVPYTRGAEYSRSVDQIVAEAEALAAAGAREIMLLGQNVNAYHGRGPDGRVWSLARLLMRLAAITGIDRLRYVTSHPRDMTDELIATHRDLSKLMPYLHLPVQSGSDRVLAAMNRGYAADDYRTLVEKLRQARPDLALSSDFIVGFPGETDRDFEQTMILARDIGFAQAFSFKYSPRPGTPAAAAPDQIDDQVKNRRLARLQDLLGAQQRAFNRACLGRVMTVLVEKPGRHPGQMVGRSPYLQPVHVVHARALAPGDMAEIRITEIMANSLNGTVATGAES